MLKSICSRRAISHVRGRWPLAILLPGIISGQTLTFCISPARVALVIGAALFTAYLAFKKREQSRAKVPPGRYGPGAIIATCAATLCFGLPVGIISGLSAFPRRADIPIGENSFLVKVVGEPRHRFPGVVEIPFLLQGSSFDGGTRMLCRGVDLPWRNVSALKGGEIVVIKGAVSKLAEAEWPFSYNATLRRRGFSATCKLRYVSHVLSVEPDLRLLLRQRLVQRVKEILGDTERAGLFLSMAIGIRDVISHGTEEAFKRAGLAHLLVVSGYQVTLVYYTLLSLIIRILLLVPHVYRSGMLPSIAQGISLGGAILFVMLVGVDGPSLRAASAVLFVTLARTLERGGGLLNGILVSLLVVALVWPGSYFEPGVQLTYAAMLGICLGSASETGSNFGKYLACCFYATLASSCIALFWFEQLSIAGFILNPIVAPLASVVACNLGFLALALALTPVDVSGWVLKIVAWFLEIVSSFVTWISEVPWAAVSPNGGVKLLVLALIVLLLMRKWYLVHKEYLFINGLWHINRYSSEWR